MKRNICLTALALVVIIALLAGCKSKDSGQSEPDGPLPDGPLPGGYSEDEPLPGGPLSGGYSEDRALTEEEMEIFDVVTDALDGVHYEPTLVATQYVAGINYRFTVTVTPTASDPEPYTTYIYAYKPSGGSPKLSENTEAEN